MQLLLGRVANIASRVPTYMYFRSARLPVSLSPLVMGVYCGKTADSIEMTFGMVGRWVPGIPDPQGKVQIFRGK